MRQSSLIALSLLLSGEAMGACVPALDSLVSWWPGENQANDIRGGNLSMAKITDPLLAINFDPPKYIY
jgi:hypothetical protein